MSIYGTYADKQPTAGLSCGGSGAGYEAGNKKSAERRWVRAQAAGMATPALRVALGL